MRTATQGIDYTTRDYRAFKELLINKLQTYMPEYTDTSETDAGIVILEALANGLDICSYYNDAIANDVLLATTQDRRMAVLLAQDLGYTPYNQTASVVPMVFTLEAPQSEDLVIGRGTVVKTVDSEDVDEIIFEVLDDLTIPAGKYGNEKGANGEYLYTVNAIQGETIANDYLGSSDGSPYQSFLLSYIRVLVDSLEVYVDEGDGEYLWTRVDNFQDCDENSRVYTVMIDEYDNCTIEFGNGAKGKIPDVYENGIHAYYRVGGGEASNVSPNTITELESGIPYVDSTFNLDILVRGHEKESLESIKENAPASYRTRDRIVTLNDYSDLLRINFYDFLCLNTTRDKDDRKLAHIFYMMKDGYEMNQDLVSRVTEFIADRSMVGTTFDLSPYVAQPVNMDCVLYIDQDYEGDGLKDNVIAYLEGVTFAYGELQFKDTIVKSDLENEIKEMFEGILSFRINTPTDDIISPTNPQNVLTKGTINITVKYI